MKAKGTPFSMYPVGSAGLLRYTNWNSTHDPLITTRYVTLEEYYTKLLSIGRLNVTHSTTCSVVLGELGALGAIGIVNQTKRFPLVAMFGEHYISLSDPAISTALEQFKGWLQTVSLQDRTLELDERSEFRRRLDDLISIPCNNYRMCLTQSIFEFKHGLVWAAQYYNITRLQQASEADYGNLETKAHGGLENFVILAAPDAAEGYLFRPYLYDDEEEYRRQHATEETQTLTTTDNAPIIVQPAPNAWWQIFLGVVTTLVAAAFLAMWHKLLRGKRFHRRPTFPWYDLVDNDDHDNGGSDGGDDRPPGPREPDVSPLRQPRSIGAVDQFEEIPLDDFDFNEAGESFQEAIQLLDIGDLDSIRLQMPDHAMNLAYLQNATHGAELYTVFNLYITTLADSIETFWRRGIIVPSTMQDLRRYEQQLVRRNIPLPETTPTQLLMFAHRGSVGHRIIEHLKRTLLTTATNLSQTLEEHEQWVRDQRTLDPAFTTDFDHLVADMALNVYRVLGQALSSDDEGLVAAAEATIQVFNNYFETDLVSTTLVGRRRYLMATRASRAESERGESSDLTEDQKTQIVAKTIEKLDKELKLFETQIEAQRTVIEVTRAANARDNLLQPANTIANVVMAGAILRRGGTSRVVSLQPGNHPPAVGGPPAANIPRAQFIPFSTGGRVLGTGRVVRPRTGR